jgi:hypothetical protein
MIHDPAIVDAVRVGWFINECTPWLSGYIGSPSQGAKHRAVLVRLSDGRGCQLARDNVEKLCLSREADGPLGRGALVHVITLALKLVDGWVKYETRFLEICIGLFHD